MARNDNDNTQLDEDRASRERNASTLRSMGFPADEARERADRLADQLATVNREAKGGA